METHRGAGNHFQYHTCSSLGVRQTGRHWPEPNRLLIYTNLERSRGIQPDLTVGQLWKWLCVAMTRAEPLPARFDLKNYPRLSFPAFWSCPRSITLCYPTEHFWGWLVCCWRRRRRRSTTAGLRTAEWHPAALLNSVKTCGMQLWDAGATCREAVERESQVREGKTDHSYKLTMCPRVAKGLNLHIQTAMFNYLVILLLWCLPP